MELDNMDEIDRLCYVATYQQYNIINEWPP
jgi:hypothetical protein